MRPACTGRGEWNVTNPNGEARGRVCRAAFLVGTAALLVVGCTIEPHPLTDAERTKEIQSDRAAMFADQEPVKGPITLDQAFARALKYNLDQRVKVMEQAVANNQLDLSTFDLLPKLTMSAGYTNRSNQNASSSESILTGTQSLQPSISSNRDSWTASLIGSWNILDFGVSYFTARQQADKALIADEQRRKVIDNLLDEVRATYWRVAGAQALNPEIARIEVEAEQALADSRRVETERLREPLDALRYQKTLLDLLRQLDVMRQELELSKAQLSALINLPPGSDFTVVVPADRDLVVTKIALSTDKMEEAALLHNPDLRTLSYQSRITVDDTKKAILKLLPGIDLSYGTNYDSNSFLTNHNWRGGAASIAWNLLDMLSAPDVIQYSENTEKLAEMRRQAVSMAILTKLHVAYDEYLYSQKLFARDSELNEVDTRIFAQTTNRVAADAQGKLDRITTEVSLVYSRLRRYQSYASVEGAVGRIYETMGLDPLPKTVASSNLDAVSEAVRKVLESWRTGDVLASLEAPAASVPAQPSAPAEAMPAPAIAALPPPTATPVLASLAPPVARGIALPIEPASIAVTTRPLGAQFFDAGLESIGQPR
jgi:outer membrane protein TolC